MKLERFGHALGEMVVKHRWKTAAIVTLLSVLFSLGVVKARFSTDYRIFFSKNDAGLEAFEKLESVFTKTDNVLFVVKAERGTVFAPDALEAIQELTEDGWKLPFASRVDSLSNFQHAHSSGDDIDVGALVTKPARDLSPAEFESVRRAATAEPLLVGSLLARDGCRRRTRAR
jgi:hypothetical protein